MPLSIRNSIDGEICQGHLLLGGRAGPAPSAACAIGKSFPFITGSLSSRKVETHHAVDQAVDIKFAIGFAEWERIRLELAREQRAVAASSRFRRACATAAFGRSFTLQVAFELEKFLPA